MEMKTVLSVDEKFLNEQCYYMGINLDGIGTCELVDRGLGSNGYNWKIIRYGRSRVYMGLGSDWSSGFGTKTFERCKGSSGESL